MLKIKKELEIKLNDYWKESEALGNEYYRFEVKECKDEDVMIKCFDDIGNTEWILEIEYTEEMTALIKNCISEFYDIYINPRTKIVRSWKGYINRKVKSLNLAIKKHDTEKVAKINQDMVERYRAMTDAKFEISEYKTFISMFYNIKAEYEQPVVEVI